MLVKGNLLEVGMLITGTPLELEEGVVVLFEVMLIEVKAVGMVVLMAALVIG